MALAGQVYFYFFVEAPEKGGNMATEISQSR
jgi:hypothetical protein